MEESLWPLDSARFSAARSHESGRLRVTLVGEDPRMAFDEARTMLGNQVVGRLWFQLPEPDILTPILAGGRQPVELDSAFSGTEGRGTEPDPISFAIMIGSTRCVVILNGFLSS